MSSSGQLFSICVNWDRLRCGDRILMQKAHFSILTLLGSFLTQQCYITFILSFSKGSAKVAIVNTFARHSNMQLQMSIILNNLKIKAYTNLLEIMQSYLKQNNILFWIHKLQYFLYATNKFINHNIITQPTGLHKNSQTGWKNSQFLGKLSYEWAYL